MHEIVPTSLVPSPDAPIRHPLHRIVGVKKILKTSEVAGVLPLLFVVAAVLLDSDGRVLVQQRPVGSSMAGLWEFPGGKVDAMESPGDALVRELREELGIGITAFEPLTFVEAPIDDRKMLMLLYVCRTWEGTPTLLHASALQWVYPDDLYALSMPPANIPLIASVAAASQRFRK